MDELRVIGSTSVSEAPTIQLSVGASCDIWSRQAETISAERNREHDTSAPEPTRIYRLAESKYQRILWLCERVAFHKFSVRKSRGKTQRNESETPHQYIVCHTRHTWILTSVILPPHGPQQSCQWTDIPDTSSRSGNNWSWRHTKAVWYGALHDAVWKFHFYVTYCALYSILFALSVA